MNLVDQVYNNYLDSVHRALGYIFDGRSEIDAKRALGLNSDQLQDLKDLRKLTVDARRNFRKIKEQSCYAISEDDRYWGWDDEDDEEE